MSNISKKGTVDYDEAKIYIIRNTENEKVYIGSTCWEISKRFNEHKRCIHKTKIKSYKLYVAMSELGPECFYWELVEKYPCDNISQLTAREGYWIKHYNSWKVEHGYNKKLEQRSRAEYYEDNKEIIKQKAKAHHEEARNEFYNEVIPCSCGMTYTRANKSRHERTKQHQQALKSNPQETE